MKLHTVKSTQKITLNVILFESYKNLGTLAPISNVKINASVGDTFKALKLISNIDTKEEYWMIDENFICIVPKGVFKIEKRNNDNPVPSLDIILTNIFKKGDIICNFKNYINGLPLFFRASQHDVDNWSGKNNKYYKIIENGVETDKVQPIYDLEKWFNKFKIEGKDCGYTQSVSKKQVTIQQHGFEIILNDDKTYYLNDTSG